MKTLREMAIGKTVKIVKVHGEGAVRRRIMDMGITKGTEVTVRKVAPLGDPIEVTVRGYELSLRKADAEMVEVETEGPLILLNIVSLDYLERKIYNGTANCPCGKPELRQNNPLQCSDRLKSVCRKLAGCYS